MKQIIQSLKSGRIHVEDTPIPSTKSGNLLIETSHTLISIGTERMLLEFGKANWIKKARSQPEKVKTVLNKIKTDRPKSNYRFCAQQIRPTYAAWIFKRR